MSATFEHPSLHLPVTEEQRDRAEHWLQEAYADGRVTSEEFDRRDRARCSEPAPARS